ncbi:MAG: ABC transporter permease [Planctomycetes bacterium]|nr:ABC transporter permease [Planctomycetota bacterium]
MPWKDVLRQLLKRRLAVACFIVMALFTFVAATATLWVSDSDLAARTSENALDEKTGLERSYHPPGWYLWLQPDHDHFRKTGQDPATKLDNPPLPQEKRAWGFFDARTWHLPLGCNIHGVSVLAKLVRGTQLAFLIGIVPTVISSIIAVIMGLCAGYFGKWIDDGIGYLINTLASIPFVLLLIAFIQAVRDSEGIARWFEKFGIEAKDSRNLILVLVVIGLTTWIGLSRLVRAEVIKHKNREYVQAARALGASHLRVIFKHILPNVMHLVIITFTLGFVGSVGLEVFLSFVGIGIDSTLHTWGQLIVGGRNELQREPSVWWPLTFATGALFTLSLAFSLFGDALRDALDPKLRT